jgi:hypothetical protein
MFESSSEESWSTEESEGEGEPLSVRLSTRKVKVPATKDKAQQLQDELREQLTATIIKGASRMQKKNLGHFKNVTKVDNYLTEMEEPNFEYNPYRISGSVSTKHKKKVTTISPRTDTTDTAVHSPKRSKSSTTTPSSSTPTAVEQSPRDIDTFTEYLSDKSTSDFKSKHKNSRQTSAVPLDASNPSHSEMITLLKN